MKRFISLLLVVTLIVAWLPVLSITAKAAAIKSGTCGDNLTWMLTDDGTLTISGTGTMTKYVADNNDYAPWNSVRSSITNVIIDEGVTTIGDCAFYGCTSLKSVIIPDSVIKIGKYAFRSCHDLTSISIPDSVLSIGKYVFADCDNLTSVVIGDSVTAISVCAFEDCTGLTSVVIGDSVTEIGYNAFYGCTRLTDVYITDISTWCMVTFENDYAHPMYYADSFYINGKLATELVIPDDVTQIGTSSFINCTSLTRVAIPDSVTTIGVSAFYGCTALASATIGSGVTTISSDAFFGCKDLSDVYYTGTQEQWNQIAISSYGNDLLKSATLHVEVVSGTIGVGSTGEIYASWEEASNACDDGDTLYLLEAIADTLFVRKNVTLDLNGFNVGGLVAENEVVTVKDSQTDDYTVEDDNGYGRITGTVSGVMAKDGYLMITENGETSFHRLNLDTVGINLRASETGIYYSGQFGGDEVIKRNIVAYGIALGAGKMPDFAQKTYTCFDADGWQTGCDSNGNSRNLSNGTLLVGIMSTNNSYSINKRNSNKKVYSCAYVELKNGERILGNVVGFSLREVVEGTDGLNGLDSMWETLTAAQKADVLELLVTYESIVQSWAIPNIKAAT